MDPTSSGSRRVAVVGSGAVGATFGFARVGREGVVQVLELPLDDDDVTGLRQPVVVLKDVARSLEVL